MFYGWRIVAVAALAQGVSIGSTFYAYGAFVKPLAAEFGASRLAVTLGLTLLTAVQGSIAPFLGRALDAGSPRAIMLTGIALHAIGLLLLSQASAFWQVGLLFALPIAVGAHLFGPITAATLVNRWFARRRGQALGFSSLGASLGGAIFAPLVATLIAGLAWRGAAAAIAGGVLLLAWPVARVVVRQPEDIGSTPDGDPLPGAGSREPGTQEEPIALLPPAEPTTVTTASLLRDRNFWAITTAIGFGYGPVSVMLAHLVPFATDLGYSSAQAGVVMGCYAFAGIVGRLLFGWLSDRMPKRRVIWLMYGWFALAWLGLLGRPSLPVLVATSIATGIAVGGIAPLWGALTGAAYARSSFGRAMGLMNFLMLPFSVAGAPIAARLFDETGSYELAFASFLACFAFGAIAIMFYRVGAPGDTQRESINRETSSASAPATRVPGR